MGHTDLDRDTLARAVDAGAALSTHLGNGAHDMIQRHHNYIWYQLACREIYASFITDGQHLPQECLYSDAAWRRGMARFISEAAPNPLPADRFRCRTGICFSAIRTAWFVFRLILPKRYFAPQEMSGKWSERFLI